MSFVNLASPRPALQAMLTAIKTPKAGDEVAGQAPLNNLTKPLGSLGRLEELALKLWRIQGQRPLQVDPAAIYTVAGDHGVVEEGISPFPQAVTRQMVLNFLNNGAAINVLSQIGGINHYVVDAGCKGEIFEPHSRLLHRKVASGSANFVTGPALSEEECLACLENGFNLAKDAADKGVRCLGLGEMGIGNTTPAAALFAAYFNLPPEAVAGPGAGLNADGVRRKSEVIQRALGANKQAVSSGDSFSILAALGGLEIATLTGLVLGGAACNLVVVVDGFISTAAYAAAWKMCPIVREYCVFSHLSQENAHKAILNCLGEKPLLDLDMRLGEGTGAALAIYLLRCAAGIFNDMATFETAGISGVE